MSIFYAKFFIKLLNLLLIILPTSFLRVTLLRLLGAQISSGVYIHSCIKVDFPWRLNIGSNCYISSGVYFDCRGGSILVGNNTDISEGVKIYTLSHNIDSVDFSVKKNNVIIGSRVWICTMSIILPGSIMSDGCVLGANSVFAGISTSDSLYIGNHAILIKKLNNKRSSNVRARK